MQKRFEAAVFRYPAPVCVDAREKIEKSGLKNPISELFYKLWCTRTESLLLRDKNHHQENNWIRCALKRERFPKTRLSPSWVLLLLHFCHIKKKAWMKVNFDLCVTFFVQKVLCTIFIYKSFCWWIYAQNKIHQCFSCG